jgi:hypothetical protein
MFVAPGYVLAMLNPHGSYGGYMVWWSTVHGRLARWLKRPASRELSDRGLADPYATAYPSARALFATRACR